MTLGSVSWRFSRDTWVMPTTVSLIGCGHMGSALARAVKRSGHDVRGFDADRGRLEALAAEGIGSATSLTDAFVGAELVILSVPTYDIATDVLRSVDDPDAWNATTVVNLVTGTPQEARACADLVLDRGADYLDGAILNYPGEVGTPEAMTVFAGAQAVWIRHRGTLMALGGESEHVAEDVGAANVLEVAAAGAFYTVALGGLAEAASYVRAEGLDPRVALGAARREAAQLLADVDAALEDVATGEHGTDQATLDVFLEAAEVWHGGMVRAGQRAELMATSVSMLKRAHDAGLGQLGFFAQVQTLDAVHGKA